MNPLQYLTFICAAFSGLCFGILLMPMVADRFFKEGLIGPGRYASLCLVGVGPSVLFVTFWYVALKSAGYS